MSDKPQIDFMPQEVIDTLKKSLVTSMQNELTPIIESAMNVSYNDALAMVIHIVNIRWDGDTVDKKELVSMIFEMILPNVTTDVDPLESLKAKWNFTK
jgi:hypothetical protein